jgi:hypothetical protein
VSQPVSDPPISIRTPFERFPATIKGAFVIRGEDADPHQVAFLAGRVARLPSGGARRLSIGSTVVDVPPHRDVFVPFEFPVADFDPGWYGLECDVELDGSPRTFRGDRRFVVAWPRASVRRGVHEAGGSVTIGGGSTLEVGRVECEATTTTVQYRVAPPRPVNIRLAVDGARLEVLDRSFAETGEGRVVAYPLPAGARRLVVEVAGGRRDRPPSAVEIDLD